MKELLQFGAQWLYLLVPLGAMTAGAIWLIATGLPSGRGRVNRIETRLANSLERVTGLPAWSAAGLLAGIGALVIAVMGWAWDVSWHIALGRDNVLFTPAHTAILTGLVGLVVAAMLSVRMATLRGAAVGWRLGSIRIPYGAGALAALGCGAITGFPLDELWHEAYGLDVTMWGPTHLLMISGASFAPIALWLFLAEAGPAARASRFARLVKRIVASAVLVGLMTFPGEFDFGVPQFQQLYHPVLLMLAASVALTAARAALGRGGALKALAGFLAIRGALALWLETLDLEVLRFPLFLTAALAVEGAFWLGRRYGSRALGVASGVAVGTIGLAGEWAWTQVWGHRPWGASLWPGVLVAVAIAVPGALLGLAAGRIVDGRSPRIGAPVLLASALSIVALLAVPFPRNGADVTATVSTTTAGDGFVNVEVALNPADAAEGADWFEVLSWQGGAGLIAELHPAGEGVYRTTEPVPVGGTWKSIVRLARHDVLLATPVYLPADAEIGASEVPVEASRTGAMVQDRRLLLREAHEGPAWPAFVAYGGILLVALGWAVTIAAAYAGVRRRHADRGRLAGRRIVITGALGGIGAAAAEAMRAEGAKVVGLDLVESPGVVATDVRDRSSVAAGLREAARRMGGIDTVINNAGLGLAVDAGSPPDEAVRRLFEVNVFGTWNVTAEALPYLMAAPGPARGQVVHVASGLAVANVPWAAAYAGSKRAVAAHADALRLEYAGRIDVTTVNPGFVRTPIHDGPAAAGVSLEGMVPADSLSSAAEAFVRACSERPRETTTGGRTASLLWLARRLPGISDRVVAWRVRRAGLALASARASFEVPSGEAERESEHVLPR